MKKTKASGLQDPSGSDKAIYKKESKDSENSETANNVKVDHAEPVTVASGPGASESQGSQKSQKSKENSATETKQGEKKEAEPVKNLSEFLRRFLSAKGKISAKDRKGFDKLERDLGEEKKLELTQLFHKEDPDLKYCIALCEFLLEGSRDSAIRLQTLDFIERVMSGYSLFEKIENNSVLQAWLQGSEGREDKLGFFEGQFRRLKSENEEGDFECFSDQQIASLLCISAIWLYFKRESDFFTLTKYLSRSVYSTQGQSNNLIEPQAFSFATSMIRSTKKKGFTYFLQMVTSAEQSLSQQLQAKAEESSFKTSQIIAITNEKNALAESNKELTNEVRDLSERIKLFEHEVAREKERARHRDTHHEDSKDDLRIKLRNVLEGELKDVLDKARIANAKGKDKIVGYQIDDALEILSRELRRMESNE